MFGQMQPMGTRSVQFVNGRMSAEAYAMAPNSQEILMDMNRPVFYWKTTDASGMSSVQEYEFKLVEYLDPDSSIRSWRWLVEPRWCSTGCSDRGWSLQCYELQQPREPRWTPERSEQQPDCHHWQRYLRSRVCATGSIQRP